jgi:peptidoglycan/xylan/chitin deacetylase (PgdA/CDA1 family)
MRIDRVISLAVSAMHSQNRGKSVAVLMYHSISSRTEPKLRSYYKMVTSPARFEQQMQWLADIGAEVVALDKWNSPFSEEHPLRVIITFDDGFADFITDAFPVLLTFGYAATMFLPTAFIETGKEHVAGMKYLTWADILRLKLSGICFGSHTVSHRHLDMLSRQEINDEVRKSAEIIQKHIGGNVTSFSCPYAFPQAYPATISALRESLADCGYTIGVTTNIGTVSLNDDPYTLKRIPVNIDDDKKLFMAKLRGGYDWLNGIQQMVRVAKKTLHR